MRTKKESIALGKYAIAQRAKGFNLRQIGRSFLASRQTIQQAIKSYQRYEETNKKTEAGG